VSTLPAKLAQLSLQERARLEGRLLKRLESAPSPVETISRREVNGPCLLSFAQQRLWFFSQLEADSPAYNLSSAARLTGPLNLRALNHSLSEIVRRHAVLRTRFMGTADGPRQVIDPPWAFELLVVDLCHLPAAEREAQAGVLAATESRRPFLLDSDRMLRGVLLRLAKNDHVLVLTFHHIATDGWSMALFAHELATCYATHAEGQSPALPELPIEYADYALWQRRNLDGPHLDTLLSFWKRHLDEALPALELPTDRARPTVPSYEAVTALHSLSSDLSARLTRLMQSERVTLFMLLLAAFATLLQRYAGQPDILVGTPVAGRTRPETERLIGFFVNTLVLRVRFAGAPTFRALLRQVYDVTCGALEHQELPFDRLVEVLHPERDLTHNPLFCVMLNVGAGAGADTALRLPGLSATQHPLPVIGSKFDLTLYAEPSAGQIALQFVGNADLFVPARLHEMALQLESLLAQIAANPDAAVSEYSLVTSDAARRLPDPTARLRSEWLGSVQARFSEQARRTPADTAILDQGETWSYAELEARSNQVANWLRASDVRPQQRVAIYATRHASLVVGMLGVLKAGAAFCLLDPAQPPSRLADRVRLAKPRAWVLAAGTDAPPPDLSQALAESGCAIRLLLPERKSAPGWDCLRHASSEVPPVTVSPDDLAYIAFTSGTTGRPKGILGTHRPLAHFIDWHARTFQFKASDRFSMLSGLSHDPLLRDIFTPLTIGAALCIPDPGVFGSTGRLAQWMSDVELTVCHLTPALGQLLGYGSAGNPQETPAVPSLRYAFFGGDRLSGRDVLRLRGLAPAATCVNFYGTTETPQAMSYYVVSEAAAEVRITIPIGRGIADVQLLVLNATHRLAGIGELGEIFVRTPYLTLGYEGDAELTQARYRTNPATRQSADRVYATGDWGRYLPDGNVEFHGRSDGQVKLRGHRIELGEIESVLARHQALRECLVLLLEDAPDNKRLVAYLVPQQSPPPSVGELREFARQRLPDHMIPAAFVYLSSLPLTPNGKVDRQALPEPDYEGAVGHRAAALPRTPAEEMLAEIWSEVLGVQAIGVHANFFDLGGHSMLAIRLFSRLEQTFRVALPMRLLFEAPTIASLAARIEALSGNGPERPQVGPGIKGSLTPIQAVGAKRPLYLLPGGAGGEGEFLVYARMARYLGLDQPMYGLKARGVDGVQPPHDTVEAMVADYLQEVRAFQPQGPYLIVGECVGGIIAFEMARELQAQGQQVGLLALLDCRCPKPSSYLNYRWRKAKERTRARWQASVLVRGLYHLHQLREVERGQRLAYAQKYIAKARQKFQWPTVTHDPANRAPVRSEGRTPLGDYAGTLWKCRPKPYGGRVILLVNEHWFAAEHDLGWARWATGGLEVRPLPGDHFSYIRQHIRSAAEQLKACLEQAQAQAPMSPASRAG